MSLLSGEEFGNNIPEKVDFLNLAKDNKMEPKI